VCYSSLGQCRFRITGSDKEQSSRFFRDEATIRRLAMRGAPPGASPMREVLRSNDAVLLSYAVSVLQAQGIGSLVADQHISVIEGSIGAFPRRLMVTAQDWPAARQALEEVGLKPWLIGDGDVHA